MDKLYMELIRRFGYEGKPVSFTEFTSDGPYLDAVRTFILILFLAHKDRLRISQVEEDLLLKPVLREVERIGAAP